MISPEIFEALKPIMAFMRIHETDTLSLNRPDSYVLATAQGGWTPTRKDLTIGDLRRLYKAVREWAEADEHEPCVNRQRPAEH